MYSARAVDREHRAVGAFFSQIAGQLPCLFGNRRGANGWLMLYLVLLYFFDVVFRSAPMCWTIWICNGKRCHDLATAWRRRTLIWAKAANYCPPWFEGIRNRQTVKNCLFLNIYFRVIQNRVLLLAVAVLIFLVVVIFLWSAFWWSNVATTLFWSSHCHCDTFTLSTSTSQRLDVLIFNCSIAICCGFPGRLN